MMVITLLSGFITANYIFTTSDLVTSSSDDLSCKSLISAKGNTVGSLLLFLSDVQLKCKKEEIILDGNSEVEDLSKIATTMSKCWDRYGSGELDFLGNFGTEGNWCFACAKLSFEDETKFYDYSETIIPYLKKGELKLSNGSKVSYHDYLNLKYFDGDQETLIDIDSGISEIENLIENGDPTLTSLVVSMSEKNSELRDLAQKYVSGEEESFVVYRYNRIPKETLDVILDVSGGFAAGIAMESVLFWGAGAVVTIATGGLAGPVVAAVGTYKAGKNYKKAEKLEKAYTLAENLISSSSDVIKYSKKSKILNTIGNFDGSMVSAFKVANKLKKVSPKFADYYLDIGKKLENLGIDNINKIDDVIKSNNLDLGKIEQLKRSIINGKLIDELELSKLGSVQSHLTKIKDLETAKKELSIVGDLTKLSKAEQISTRDKLFKYARNTLKLGAGLLGASTASAYNSNNVQYVDILNKEQYYRLCGTEPIITK